jgi:hypothetical protein
MLHKLKAVRARVGKAAHKPLVVGGGCGHLAYLTAAALEGHGAYAIAAVGLAIIVAIGFILGEGGAE